jgi:hypothetical protein
MFSRPDVEYCIHVQSFCDYDTVEEGLNRELKVLRSGNY